MQVTSTGLSLSSLIALYIFLNLNFVLVNLHHLKRTFYLKKIYIVIDQFWLLSCYTNLEESNLFYFVQFKNKLMCLWGINRTQSFHVSWDSNFRLLKNVQNNYLIMMDLNAIWKTGLTAKKRRKKRNFHRLQ